MIVHISLSLARWDWIDLGVYMYDSCEKLLGTKIVADINTLYMYRIDLL